MWLKKKKGKYSLMTKFVVIVLKKKCVVIVKLSY